MTDIELHKPKVTKTTVDAEIINVLKLDAIKQVQVVITNVYYYATIASCRALVICCLMFVLCLYRSPDATQ